MPEVAQRQTATHILTIKCQVSFLYGRVAIFLGHFGHDTNSENFPRKIQQGWHFGVSSKIWKHQNWPKVHRRTGVAVETASPNRRCRRNRIAELPIPRKKHWLKFSSPTAYHLPVFSFIWQVLKLYYFKKFWQIFSYVLPSLTSNFNNFSCSFFLFLIKENVSWCLLKWLGDKTSLMKLALLNSWTFG